MSKKKVVVALGHKALGATLPQQQTAVKNAAKAIADLVEADCQVVISHSNAPQVGMIHTAMNEFGKQHPDAGKYIVGTGTIHGGEYTNIIADHVVLNGNIRAVHEETYMALEHELERNLQEMKSRLAHRSVWNFQKIRYMHLPMMRNLQRQQR